MVGLTDQTDLFFTISGPCASTVADAETPHHRSPVTSSATGLPHVTGGH